MGTLTSKSSNKKNKNTKRQIVLIYIGLAICLFVMIFSCYQVVSYYAASIKSKEKMKELIACTTVTPNPSPVVTEVITKEEQATEKETITPALEKDENGILLKYKTLYERNPDMIGWILIEGTKVNYPVMQTKEDEEFYLKRDFDKEKDIRGLPFLDARCDVTAHGTNQIIYGHNMKDGSMFATLLKYEDEEYYKEHKNITFDTVHEKQTYEIIAVFQSRIAYQGEDTFRYYSHVDFKDEEQFRDYLANIKALSYYDTGKTASYGDDLITLSTCDRRIKNGRFVVVARKKISPVKLKSF